MRWPRNGRSSDIAGRLTLLALFGAFATVAAAGSNIAVAAGTDVAGASTVMAATTVATPTLAQLVGQKLMVSMSGTAPDADLLARIGRGEIGGVILFGANVSTASSLKSLTRQLQAAAAAGGQPPLLIATDQEGGTVRRVTWAPPTLSPPVMGSLNSPSTASAQGKAAGFVLLCAGINDDLAPVADVPSSTSSFIYLQGRTWSFNASTTATLSDAFASGLKAGGDIPAMKHFPGLGFATRNTDSNVVTITASKSALAPGLLPYQKAIANHVPLIMLSNATYTAYDSVNAAGWSHAIGVDLLRNSLGFTGVTITDSLSGTAAARGVSTTSLALRAARAGTDMILLSGSEAATRSTYASLLADAQGGTIPLATLQTSYARIVALKAKVAAPVHDTTAPTVAAPVSRIYTGSTLGSTTSPVRTSWSATDPCGISAYIAERKVNGGAWALQGLPSTTTTSVAQSLRLGSTYRYIVKATDGAGNRSGWAYGPFIEPLVAQQSSTAVRFGGIWKMVASSSYSGGSTKYATAAGASASYTFTGSGIGWVTAVGPTRGSAKVYIDGVYKKTVSLHSSTTALRRIAYAINWRSQGRHTIKVVVVGSAGHPRIDVDAFVRLYRP
jgi:beta-N-acetylhexosaminidase